MIVSILIIIVFIVADTPSRPTNINISHKSFDMTSFSVTLRWDLSVERVFMYHVNTSVGLSLLMEASTNTTSIEVSNIPYNQQITVSIASVNCYSESAKATFNITISEIKYFLGFIVVIIFSYHEFSLYRQLQ